MINKDNPVKHYTYNLTEYSYGKNFLPENIKELKYLLKKKKNILLKTGGCGHGDKSSLKRNCNIISLQKFNRILKLERKKKFVTVQTGISLIDLVKKLKQEGYYIFNIPGGPNVSLGGAIAGNVHGRISNKSYPNFGDNVHSFKIIDNNFQIKKITRKNKFFYSVIGSLGYYGIILEAKLKIHKIQNYFYLEKNYNISSKKEFLDFDKQNKKYFGYLNYFSKKMELNVNTISPLKIKNKDKSFVKIKKIKLPNLMWLFVNKYTLYFLYFFLFRLKRLLFIKKKNKIPLEKTIYISQYISALPSFFKNGFLEIQFCISKNRLLKIIYKIINLIKLNKVFPIFFIIKKLDKSKQKYCFNFPIYNHSISLGFSKKQFAENNLFFLKLYDYLNENNCNLYVTKDELFSLFLDKKYINEIKFKQKKSNYNFSNFINKF